MRRGWLLLLATFLFSQAVLAADEWYNAELVHNAVHDVETALEDWPGRIEKDEKTLKESFDAFEQAVDHLHKELHNGDNQDDAQIISKAYAKLQAPYDRLVKVVRENHVKTKKVNLHTWDMLGVVDAYHRLKFWMTPVK